MKITIYVAIIALLLTSACRRPKELVYTSIQNFSMEQGAKSSVTLDIRLYNPNSYNIKLKKSDVAVSLNSMTLGHLSIDGRHTAPKRDTFLLPVTLALDPQISLPSLLPLLMGEVKLKLTGTIKGGRHGFYIRVPVNYEGTENLLSSMK